MSERVGTIHIELTADELVFDSIIQDVSELVYGDTLAPGGLDAIVSCHIDGSCDDSPHCTGGQVKQANDRHAALVARVQALADELHERRDAPLDGALDRVTWVGALGSAVFDLRALLTDDDRGALDAVRGVAWDEGFEGGEAMARAYGHTDHWEDPLPTNPYRRDATEPES